MTELELISADIRDNINEQLDAVKEIKRIHPEHATPVLFANLQRAYITLTEKSIETMEGVIELHGKVDNLIREVERLANITNGNHDP